MKKLTLYFLLMLMALSHVSPLRAVPRHEVVSGVVRDRAGKKRIEGAGVMVPGTNIGTVTNKDGYFSLTVPDSIELRSIKIEQLGYKTTEVRLQSPLPNKPLELWLAPSSKLLDEVTVYGGEPYALIETALQKIPENYPLSTNMFTAFYRETIQKGRRYVDVSEAIISVQKSPYKRRGISGDRVQVVKGRRLMSHNPSDTLAVKIAGGPNLPVIMDFVKNENLLFTVNELSDYRFKMEPMAEIDDRPQFVIRFTPVVLDSNIPLNEGVVYIDMETLAFTRAVFRLDLSDKAKATRAILYKKPRGLHFKPQEVEFTVSYKQQDGMTYLNYVRTKMRFKCDWKRRLFSSGYTVYAEMVMVDRDDAPSWSILNKESFGSKEIFHNIVDNFNDADFWEGYTIIEPTESLEKAVGKLGRQKKP